MVLVARGLDLKFLLILHEAKKAGNEEAHENLLV
jgi:hypothetical protein